MPGPINSIPDEVLEAIFKRVDDKRHLLKVCTRVCKRWNKVLNWRFWSSYLMNDLPTEESREYKSLFKKHPSFQQQRSAMLAIERPLGRNLTGPVVGNQSIAIDLASGKSDWVVNPKLDKNWQGGSSWIIEYPGSEHSQTPESAVLASSFRDAHLNLTINPKSLFLGSWPGHDGGQGINLKLLYRLEVEVATRHDCGGRMEMSVNKYNTPPGDPEVRCLSDAIERRLDPGTEWHFEEFTATFHGEITSIGIGITCKDDRFWSGHYGTKVKRIKFTLQHVE